MSIDYRSDAFPEHLRKPAPRVLVKKAKRTQKDSEEKRIKAEIRKAQPLCIVCRFRRGAECHEFKFRSVGGRVAPENTGRVCAPSTGGLCHQLLQAHSIGYEFLTPRGAAGLVRFTMNRSVADAVFGRRVVPRHIEITK